ncbi:sugar ABC transporter ATP-binding protein [Protaetiibacter intestinalis]|uniref:sugar ABC transporter ATP-binding protein n=1 Tax=Protaetiibacter intestinalis TaxID=2419774 RepID=UPI0013005C26|nr:sugar ABC transporter ATP-binding protein [Protaetiibacter intestinalis]
MTHTEHDARLRVRGLSKRYGGAVALSAVDLDIHRGEVHGLVGANGAGKSTLIRCLAGVVRPDEGEILLDGEPLELATPRDAERAGFAFIHQELNLVPHFDAVDNILLGIDQPTRLGLVRSREARVLAKSAAERIGADFPLDRRVDELSVGDRWLIMIARALVQNASLIAMDEPTASLSDQESASLFRIVRELAASGVSILYVSHRLDEVLDLSDRITVFRDGRVTDRAVRGDLDKRGLIRAIVGHEVKASTRQARDAVDRSAPLFEAVGVRDAPMVREVSFSVYPGEVLGLGGLVGAGRTEVARLAFGAEKLDAGHFLLDGAPYAPRSVANAVARGVALIPEERRSQALLLEKSVSFNASLAALDSLRSLGRLPFVSDRRTRSRTLEIIRALAVKTAGPAQNVGRLSGGNQQKVVIGRWLLPGIRLIFFDEPSRGVDVGAREEIHAAIRDFAARGVATVVISSDVEELAMLCDRVVVLREGEVTGELEGAAVTEENIVELSYAPVHELQEVTR